MASSATSISQPDTSTGNHKGSTEIISHGPEHDSEQRTRLTSRNDSTESSQHVDEVKEKRLRLKVDLRLCTIAGILCSLNLIDSGIISSASVTTMFEDLHLQGNRYSISIFIFTIASIVFQLPATLASKFLGPRIFFSITTFMFGLITFCTAFIHTWREMIALRILLGIAMSGIYPGLSLLLSSWYTRQEQQLRFAYLQTGEVFILATGGIVNYGLQQLHGAHGLAGWRWMFLVQGVCAMFIGLITYLWIVDFPEKAHKSFRFLTSDEQALAVQRIEQDRGDVQAKPFTWTEVFRHAADIKVYGFAIMFFLLNIVSTALSYFLPIILQGGLGFSTNEAILLNAPPYYYAIIPVILSSLVADRFRLRGPVIIFNSICLIVGFVMLGFTKQSAVRYVGTFLATGAYVSNWAALTTYYQNNIVGQWKRAFAAAVVTAFNGAGGVTGAYIFKQNEAPGYPTAIWVAISSHIAMIAAVLCFTAWFWRANRSQSKGRKIIEETPGFRHTY